MVKFFAILFTAFGMFFCFMAGMAYGDGDMVQLIVWMAIAIAMFIAMVFSAGYMVSSGEHGDKKEEAKEAVEKYRRITETFPR